MKTIRVVVLALMIPGLVTAQGRGPDPDRRAQLEEQIRQRFLRSVADRLELTETQRERVREVMAEGAEARRELANDARALRMELLQAVRADTTPMTRFEAILERLESVRARETEIEQREDAALAEFLDARQRAVLIMMRMQFNDRVRRMRGMPGRVPGGVPGGPPGGPGGPPGETPIGDRGGPGGVGWLVPFI
jgi:Spy/CpxP family protein refolding chaperone